jgi:subtilisin family serine protease
MNTRLAGTVFILLLSFALTRAQSEGEEYIVVLRGGQSIENVNREHGTRTLRHIPNSLIYLVVVDPVDENAPRRLREDRAIEIVEKNKKVKLSSGDELPVSSTVAQTASSLDGQTLTTFYGSTVLKSYVEQVPVFITELNQARSLSTGAATRVAYIDTGVDFYHPALRPWLDPGADLVFGKTASETEGLPAQTSSLLNAQMASLLDHRFSSILNQAMASLLDGGNYTEGFPPAWGHGTLVAGIIHLFAPEARIVPLKAFDAYGNTTLFTIVEAVYKARDLDVDVVNMSFSIAEDSPVLEKAISEAHVNGISLVASVGNDGTDGRDVYPAAYSQVIGVAATDFSDRRASFSNYGKPVSVAAPGDYVVSTVPGARYAAAWGTSFSAPIVSGTVALLVSRGGRGQSASQTTVTTADPIDQLNPGFEKKLGKGRINVQQSLRANQ